METSCLTIMVRNVYSHSKIEGEIDADFIGANGRDGGLVIEPEVEAQWCGAVDTIMSEWPPGSSNFVRR